MDFTMKRTTSGPAGLADRPVARGLLNAVFLLVLAMAAIALTVPSSAAGAVGLLAGILAFAAWLRARYRQRVHSSNRHAALALWLATLIISAMIVVPQLITESYSHLLSHILFGLLWWLVLAAFLRVVIFYTDRLFVREPRRSLRSRHD
jgi:cytochrome bd-type quinol oxidase subunit 2